MQIYQSRSWNLLFSYLREKGVSEEHTARVRPGGVGSDFWGDQRGQKICMPLQGCVQTSTSRETSCRAGCEVIPLCNRSGATVQRKKSMQRIRRAYPRRVVRLDDLSADITRPALRWNRSPL